MEDWWDYVGPGHIPLLSAISEGLVTRAPGGLMAGYVFDGEPVGTNQVRALGKLKVIETSLSGAPSITPDGERVLREWDEAEWWRRWHLKHP